MKSKAVNIYTDGSSLGNPGPGGYGIILEWVGMSHVKEFSGGFARTTNNRMELLAVIIGLELIKKSGMEVVVYSDSKYVVDAIEKNWIYNWEQKNFQGKKNVDLWKRFIKIYKNHRVHFEWIKGHNKHPQNERCDRMAVNAAKGKNLPLDVNFEKTENDSSKV
ncbi:MAG: ribonuclease HI [Flavobacteriaceae bacterium TMED179]|nr:MAG: ribonuclease HI [Flavobacteriaceae bacterium TMED179]